MKTKMTKKYFFLAVLYFVGVLFQLPLLFKSIGRYDEGLVLCCASRILHGELPYKSFWSLYAPGQFYVLSGLFSVFGESVIVERIWDILVRGFISFGCFLLVRRHTSTIAALLCFISVSAWLHVFAFCGYPVYPFLALALFGLLALLRSIRIQSWRWGIGAGLLAGGSTLFRHDMGILFILGVSMALAVFSAHAHFRRTSNSSNLRHLTVIVPLSATVLPLVATGILLVAGCGADMWEQLIQAATTFSAYRGLPYPSLPEIITGKYESLYAIRSALIYRIPFILFPGILMGMGVCGAMSLLRRRELRDSDNLCIILLFAGLAFAPQAFGRSDFMHLLPMGLIAVVDSYILVAACRAWFLRMALVLLATAFWWLPLRDYSPSWSGPIPAMTEDLADVVSYVRHHHQGEAIYVGVENHDQFVANAPAIYFLAGSKYGTEYHWLEPGVVTTRQVQEKIVDDLVKNQVQVIILSNQASEEPNESSIDRHVDILDQHIRDHYQEIKRYGQYRVLTQIHVHLPETI